MVFGILFGELLGDLGHRVFGMEPLWFDRAEAIGPLLALSVGVGVVHVSLGLVLGVWLAWRSGSRRDTVEKAAQLVALAGMVALAGALTERLPAGFVTPSLAALVLGTVALLAAQGTIGLLMAPLEVLRLLGGVLSYLRIGALGVASVQLARTGNELGSLGPVWLGVVVATLLHALNLALGVFSPTIQALRLHYVEFFSAFYRDGGCAFTPFGASASEGSLTGAA